MLYESHGCGIGPTSSWAVWRVKFRQIYDQRFHQVLAVKKPIGLFKLMKLIIKNVTAFNIQVKRMRMYFMTTRQRQLLPLEHSSVGKQDKNSVLNFSTRNGSIMSWNRESTDFLKRLGREATKDCPFKASTNELIATQSLFSGTVAVSIILPRRRIKLGRWQKCLASCLIVLRLCSCQN